MLLGILGSKVGEMSAVSRAITFGHSREIHNRIVARVGEPHPHNGGLPG
jgi:hypothetical protein